MDDTVGALCRDDYKGINNQYVGQGKVVVVESICGNTIRWLGGSAENRTTTGFRWNLWGGTENIVTEEKITSWDGKDVSPTLTAHNAGGSQRMPDKGNFTCVIEENKAVDAKNFVEGEVNGTLTSAAGHNTESNNVVRQRYAVRRLTPIECERLQGLPDNYTLLEGEKICSDSARYKALGNGMAQPVADFVIRRIVEEVEGCED